VFTRLPVHTLYREGGIGSAGKLMSSTYGRVDVQTLGTPSFAAREAS
jgi:hypothetical protein